MATLTDYRATAAFIRPDDWTGIRKLAQTAANDNHLAIITQTFYNDGDGEIVNEIEFLPAALAAIINTDNNGHTEEIPMGSTRSFEIFTPEAPTGFFGPDTDLNLLP